MRLLFVKENLAWPRSSGHDVHCYQMMRALSQLGHTLALVTLRRPSPEAVAGLVLDQAICLQETVEPTPNGNGLVLSGLQERFRSYWGIDPAYIHAVGKAARDWGADVVIVVGLNVLPYLVAVENALRIWYAADEWAWHHLSQVQVLRPHTWENVKQAFIKGLYERAYAPLLDRVWVVSEGDRRAMRWLGGMRHLDVLPNGVDGEHFTPLERPQAEQSCVFWGRLDFGPNVQALEWFCRRVWPAARRVFPKARFTIYGFQPTPRVQDLEKLDGVQIIPNLPDLRGEIAAHQVVVLPFVSGGGIKNKLLEAAAMGKAVICSPRACGGLRGSGETTLLRADTVGQWVRELTALWGDAGLRGRLGHAARRWVTEQHTWQASARAAAAGLEGMLGARRSS
jgi:polysaccharide biosynthesis protein PslH